jgi:hypothetical protein
MEERLENGVSPHTVCGSINCITTIFQPTGNLLESKERVRNEKRMDPLRRWRFDDEDECQ